MLCKKNKIRANTKNLQQKEKAQMSSIKKNLSKKRKIKLKKTDQIYLNDKVKSNLILTYFNDEIKFIKKK
jgi:hypothetical protein